MKEIKPIEILISMCQDLKIEFKVNTARDGNIIYTVGTVQWYKPAVDLELTVHDLCNIMFRLGQEYPDNI